MHTNFLLAAIWSSICLAVGFGAIALVALEGKARFGNSWLELLFLLGIAALVMGASALVAYIVT